MNRLAAALALALVCAPASCRSAASASLPEPPPGEAWITPEQVNETHLKVEPLAQHEVDSTITASGRVTFDDSRVGHVYSPVAGRVMKIQANLGDHLKKGAPLATLSSPEVGAASADVDKANADLIAAEHDLARQKELYESHAGAKRDYEVAQDNYMRAKAELERAKQKGALLQTGSVDVVSQGFTLRSPIDGEVLLRNITLGMEVQGQYSGGTALEVFTIGEIDPIWVMADVYEMDLARVKRGARASVKVVSYPGRAFEGKVDWVSDTLDPSTRTARVRCTLPNAGHELKPEMFATVVIDASGQNVLAVPRRAVLHMGEQAVVFVQAGEAPGGRVRFERRPVKVDEDDEGDWVPVLQGLQAGDPVVTAQGILLSALAKP